MGTQQTWHIGVTSWMIYEDIVQGSEIPFAVAFGWDFAREPYPFARTSDRTTVAAHQSGCRYRVCGEIVYAVGWTWVLNCCMRIFFKDNPKQNYTPKQPYVVGDYLMGEVLLGVDPRSYLWLKPQPVGMPLVLYSWAIEGVSKQTAPFVEVKEERGTSVYKRDAARLGYQPVDRAVASHGAGWNDDYILHCTLRGVHNGAGARVIGRSPTFS